MEKPKSYWDECLWLKWTESDSPGNQWSANEICTYANFFFMIIMLSNAIGRLGDRAVRAMSG